MLGDGGPSIGNFWAIKPYVKLPFFTIVGVGFDGDLNYLLICYHKLLLNSIGFTVAPRIVAANRPLLEFGNERGSVVNRRFRPIFSTNLPSPYNHRRPDHHNVNVDRLFEANARASQPQSRRHVRE